MKYLVDMNVVIEMYQSQPIPEKQASVLFDIFIERYTQLNEKFLRSENISGRKEKPYGGYVYVSLNGRKNSMSLMVDVTDPMIFSIFQESGAQKPKTKQRFLGNCRKNSSHLSLLLGDIKAKNTPKDCD